MSASYAANSASVTAARPFWGFLSVKLVEEFRAAHFLHRQALKAVNCAFRWLWLLSVSRYRVCIYSECSRCRLTSISERIINKFVGSWEWGKKISDLVVWVSQCRSSQSPPSSCKPKRTKTANVCVCGFRESVWLALLEVSGEFYFSWRSPVLNNFRESMLNAVIVAVVQSAAHSDIRLWFVWRVIAICIKKVYRLLKQSDHLRSRFVIYQFREDSDSQLQHQSGRLGVHTIIRENIPVLCVRVMCWASSFHFEWVCVNVR